MLLRQTALIALCVSLASVASAQSTGGGAFIDRVADRIAREALIRDAAMTAGLPAIQAHARHDDERLAVSVARAVVFSVLNLRGQVSYEADLKSAAEAANRSVKLGLEMLAGGGDFLTNVVEGGSALQELRNVEDEVDAFELKSNHQFGADDVRDIKTVMRFLPAANNDAAFAKARRSVRTALERNAALLEPFAKEAPASPTLIASRQRVSAMLAPFRR